LSDGGCLDRRELSNRAGELRKMFTDKKGSAATSKMMSICRGISWKAEIE